MRIHLFIFILIAYIAKEYSFAQVGQSGIVYTYDNNGNRIKREFTILRIASDTAGAGVEMAETLAEQFGVNLFPNPAEDVLNIAVSNIPEGEKVRASVFDVQGRLLQTAEVTSTNTALPFHEHPPGIYHIRVTVGIKDLYYKVLKK